MARPTRSAGRVAPVARLVSAVAVAGLLAACTAEVTPAEPVTPPPVTATPEIEPSRSPAPEPELPVVWPLTGVEVDAVPERPAVAVKIENTSSARPQSGLEHADVVWETVVEFEVSRLVAVYHSQVPEEVGPIRSVRPMDPAIVAPLRGLLAYSGGQQGILDMVRASGVQSVSHDAGAPGMYRVRHRRAPHNVYGSLPRFVEQADDAHRAAPAEQFRFAPEASRATAAVQGAPAASLEFRLSSAARPSWTWDGGSGRWLRSEAGGPASAATGERLSAVNVVSVTAPHPATGFGAQGGASVPTYDLVGQGPLTVATGGQVVTGTWRKEADDAPMRLIGPDGAEILLAPGNTWVELVPAGSGSLTVG